MWLQVWCFVFLVGLFFFLLGYSWILMRFDGSQQKRMDSSPAQPWGGVVVVKLGCGGDDLWDSRMQGQHFHKGRQGPPLPPLSLPFNHLPFSLLHLIQAERGGKEEEGA